MATTTGGRMELGRARGARRPLRWPPFGGSPPAGWEQAARRLDGKLYAVAGAGQAHRSGHGHSGGRRVLSASVSVRVAHVVDGRDIEVETTDEERRSAELADRWLLNDVLHRAVTPDVTFPFALRADRWEQPVVVDGSPVRLVFVGNDVVWSALGSHSGRQVRVAGRGWARAGLALSTIPAAAVSLTVPDRA